MTDMRFIIACLLCYCIIHLTKAQTGADVKDLRQKLFVTDGYDKKVRAANDQTDPTEVEVNLFLLSIHELDEVTETLKTTAYLEITWQDDFLQWTPADCGGLERAYFPQDDIWKPDVTLKNSMVEYKELGVKTLNVEVDYGGIVTWYPFQVFQSSCSVNIKYFPFDVQTCQLKFGAWSYSRTEVNMQSGAKGIVLERYKPSTEWDIISSGVTVEGESGEVAIIFSLTMRRKPRYIFLSIMFPIIMLSILNVFVFALPSDSGEKASYAVTVFLAFAVFLTIVASSLPENSDATALFWIYIIIQTAQSTLITIIALILIRLNNINPETRPVPQWLLSLIKLITCKNRKHRSTVEPDLHGLNVESLTNAKDELKTRSDASKAALNDDNYDWKRLVNTLDWFFLVLFGLLAFLSTFLCFLLAYVLSN